MRVSVITAVRNAAETIGVTLRSVAEQSYPDIEHVIVDGASTDRTLEVVAANAARVARVVSEPDSGVYDAFNKGWRLATGDIVVYLNAADQYSDSKVIQRVVHAFVSRDLDVAFGDVHLVDPKDPSRVRRHYRSDHFQPSRLVRGFMPAHPSMFVRRTIYERLGGYDPTYRIAGDFEFCLRLFLGQPVRYEFISGPPLVRMPLGGLSNRGWRSSWIITREMQRACERNRVPTSFARLASRLPAKLLETLRRHG